jgi:hypothetical protein
MISWLEVSSGVIAKAEAAEIRLKITAMGRSIADLFYSTFSILSRRNCCSRAGVLKIDFWPATAERKEANVKEAQQDEKRRESANGLERTHIQKWKITNQIDTGSSRSAFTKPWNALTAML